MSEVIWMPVTEILANLRSSCDFGDIEDYGDNDDNTALWREIISAKAADGGFMHLVDSIMKHGFREDGAIGWRWEGHLGNGHHRLVAAILLGLDSVPTVEGWGREWDDCPDDLAGYAHDSRSGEYYGIVLEV